MAKFNIVDRRRFDRNCPLGTEQVATIRTHEGAPAYARDTKSELFLLAVTNFVGGQPYRLRPDAPRLTDALPPHQGGHGPTRVDPVSGGRQPASNPRAAQEQWRTCGRTGGAATRPGIARAPNPCTHGVPKAKSPTLTDRRSSL